MISTNATLLHGMLVDRLLFVHKLRVAKLIGHLHLIKKSFLEMYIIFIILYIRRRLEVTIPVPT